MSDTLKTISPVDGRIAYAGFPAAHTRAAEKVRLSIAKSYLPDPLLTLDEDALSANRRASFQRRACNWARGVGSQI